MGVTEKLEKLKEAETNYELANTACQMARAEETQMLNRLNEAQRAFDAEIDSVKQDSPGGDWKNRNKGYAEAS